MYCTVVFWKYISPISENSVFVKFPGNIGCYKHEELQYWSSNITIWHNIETRLYFIMEFIYRFQFFVYNSDTSRLRTEYRTRRTQYIHGCRHFDSLFSNSVHNPPRYVHSCYIVQWTCTWNIHTCEWIKNDFIPHLFDYQINIANVDIFSPFFLHVTSWNINLFIHAGTSDFIP